MKKSEMKKLGIKTAELQRIFRRRHYACVHNGSELSIGFMKKNKNSKQAEHMATCSQCLIDTPKDTGENIGALI